MAAIGKIRSWGPALIVVIGLGLFAFIAEDWSKIVDALFGKRNQVGTVLGICILAICGYVAVICLGRATPGALAYLSSHVSYTEYGFTGPGAWFSMLMIVVFFMNGYEACVPASIGIIRTRKDVFVESLVTALLCSLSTMVFTFIFASGMPDVLTEEIPTLWAIDHLSNAGFISRILYVIFAVSAMLSSSVAFIFE